SLRRRPAPIGTTDCPPMRPAPSLPESDRKRALRRLLGCSLGLMVLGGLAIAWHYTPLRELIDPQAFLAWVGDLRDRPLAPLIVIGVFLLVGLLMLPVTPAVVLAVGAFPPVFGFFYALFGVSILAAVAFGVGRLAGRGQVQRLAGSRVHRVSQRLGDAGVLTITMARMVPVAHFTIISLTAGASHIRWRDFLIGTALGMAPGIAVVALAFHQATAAAQHPQDAQVAALVLGSIGLLAALFALRLWRRRGG
ncbi:MAG: VTT domain-containing protein, partial [Halofilum sp. (in: g-proteobacteria)]